MAGLTIREFTVSTKVVSKDKSEKSKNQSMSEYENTSQNGSGYSNHRARSNNMDACEKENIIQICVDKVLEIMQHRLER